MLGKWGYALVIGIGISTAGMHAGAASPEWAPEARAKISAKLFDELTQKSGLHDVLVIMDGDANLTGASRQAGKRARVRLVRDALRRSAQSTQAQLRADLSARHASFQPYYVANAIAIDSLSAAEVEGLALRKDVRRVVSNASFRVLERPAAAQLHADGRSARAIGENITATGADRVWSELGKRGEGVVVAGQDTGIDWDHPGLINQYRGKTANGASHSYNWHDAVHMPLNPSRTPNPCGYSSPEPCDDHGHGTHTIGTAVGSDGSNQVGMAPGAKWMGCRNMDDGVGKPSTYLECFQFFLAPWPYGGDPERDGNPDMAPDVTNNSWGCPTDEGCEGAEFLAVLQAFKAAGIMTVAAAGNSGSGCSTIEDSPAHHTDEVLVVGAIDHRSSNIASFSSRGPSKYDNKISPDVTAPGVNVRSTIPGGGYQGLQWSGTSMASPHVAGAVALLWSARPELKGQVDATVERLRATASPKTSTQTCGGTPGSSVPNNTFGNGILNVFAAATAP